MSVALREIDAYDIIRQEMGHHISLNDAIAIAWEFTGYPAFWNIPEDGAMPQECFRKQIREFRDEQGTA